ncbi:MAG: hypothetical protein V3W20_09280 [Candidatus Neomarinimicrobiota bacterium]
MKKILFALLFISMALSQFENTIAGWYNDDYYIPSGSVYSEGLIVADESTLAAETLNEVDFATHAKWDVTNDFDDTGGNAAFIWSANQTSTLTQTQVNLATAGVSSRWYVFTYTLAVTTAFDGDAAATITTSFALTAVPLEIVTAGTYTLYFKSAVTPTDFVISIVSGSDTEGTISYDDLTLKEITGGDMYVAGTVNASTIFAAGSFTLKTGTGTTVLTVDADGKLYMDSDGTGPQITLTGNTDATADAIILLSAAGATNVQGLKLWYDRDTAYGYIDNIYNNDAGNIYIRTKTAAAPFNNLTILGTGNVNIGSALFFNEKASQETIVAGEGQYWVKDSSPTTPMFTDDDGDDHILRFGSNDFAEMYFNANGNPTTIETVNTPIAVRNFTTGTLSGWTYVVGSTGAVTAYYDRGANVGVHDDTHGLATGDIISIRGTTNYNGMFSVTVVDADSFYIADTWVANDGASDWDEGDYLLAGAGAGGVYMIDYNISTSEGGGAGSTVNYCIYLNTTPQPKTIIQRKFANNDVGAVGGGGEATVSAGDRLIFVQQSSGTNALTNSYGNVRIQKL